MIREVASENPHAAPSFQPPILGRGAGYLVLNAVRKLEERMKAKDELFERPKSRDTNKFEIFTVGNETSTPQTKNNDSDPCTKKRRKNASGGEGRDAYGGE